MIESTFPAVDSVVYDPNEGLQELKGDTAEGEWAGKVEQYVLGSEEQIIFRRRSDSNVQREWIGHKVVNRFNAWLKEKQPPFSSHHQLATPVFEHC
jgi:hypothetical protein